MKKTSLAIAALLVTRSAFSVFGPEFDHSARPHSICAIEFFSEHNPNLVDEICSVVMVSPRIGFTAGHCTPNLPERNHRILCRDGLEAQIISASNNTQLDLARLRFNDEEHALDTAYVVLDRELEVPNIDYAKGREEMLTIIDQAEICGVFGHGGLRENLRSQGLSTNAQIRPKDILFDGDLVQIEGYGGMNSGLVEPGDSGGSLACKTQNGKWFHLAQVSGRTMNAQSLFAPIDLLVQDMPGEILETVIPNPQDKVAQRWREGDLGAELEQCMVDHQRLTQQAFVPSSSLSLYENKERCLQARLDYAKEQIQNGRSFTSRIRPYTQVVLDQTDESIMLRFNRPNTRYLTEENPFSTVDHFVNAFEAQKLDGDYAIGKMIMYGHAESFACRFNIICEAGTYENVRLKLSDLTLNGR